MAAQFALNAADTRTLELLDRLGPKTAREIAQHTGLAATSVTALIDRLESKRLVRRASHPKDRRKVVVELLPQPAEMKQPYARIARATLRLMERFSDRELEAIAEFLNEGAQYAEGVVAELAAPTKGK